MRRFQSNLRSLQTAQSQVKVFDYAVVSIFGDRMQRDGQYTSQGPFMTRMMDRLSKRASKLIGHGMLTSQNRSELKRR